MFQLDAICKSETDFFVISHTYKLLSNILFLYIKKGSYRKKWQPFTPLQTEVVFSVKSATML